MIFTILFCTMSMYTMCILFASYARLESLQAKNWALSRCCPRGPVGENIYPLHRGTFVERLEHHCHGGSLPVLAGRDGGSRSRICCYVSFPQFFGWIFVGHHLTTPWERIQALFHVSVVGSIFSRMVVILAVNTSNFHEFSLLVWVSSLLFTSGPNRMKNSPRSAFGGGIAVGYGLCRSSGDFTGSKSSWNTQGVEIVEMFASYASPNGSTEVDEIRATRLGTAQNATFATLPLQSVQPRWVRITPGLWCALGHDNWAIYDGFEFWNMFFSIFARYGREGFPKWFLQEVQCKN